MAEEPIEPLLFHQAIKLLPKHKDIAKKAHTQEFDLTMLFMTVLERHMYDFLFLEPLLCLRLLILLDLGNSSKLLYSGLFGGPNLKSHDGPLQIWILNSEGGLKRIETCTTLCPKLNRHKKDGFFPNKVCPS